MSPSSIWLTHAMQGRARRTTTLLLSGAAAALLAALALPAGAHAQGVSPVSVSALSPAEVEALLSGIPLESLPATQLSEALSQRLSSSPTSGLKGALEEAIAGLAAKGGTLGQLAGSSELTTELEKQIDKLPLLEQAKLKGELEQLLGHSGAQTLSTMLSEELASLEARQVMGALLTTAKETGQPVGPEQLIEEALTAPTPERLENALGTALGGEPFSVGTVEGLASHEGTTSEGLAEGFGATSSQLPGNAMALSTPLRDGETLGVVDAAEGVDVGTLTNELPGGGGGSGGSGGSGGGTGGPGGVGGSGGASSPAPGNTSVVEDLSTPAAGSPGARAQSASVKVKILSRKVSGDAITLVVRAPAAGRLTVAGKGVRSVSRTTDEAERLTLRAVLTKAEAASLHRGHRHLHVKLDVSFKPVSGASSTASTSVTVG